MIKKDIMADSSSDRVDSKRNTLEMDLTTTLERKRKIATCVRACGISMSVCLITLRDGLGLYYLLTIKDKAVSISRWFSVGNLALNIILIFFFGDSIRRIHLSQNKISQMKADAPFFISHFLLILILAITDIFYMLWLVDKNFDF
jgi:hypothetical protein